MELSHFHFAHPLWLWSLLLIPLVWGLFFLLYREQQPLHQLERFIDKHLIPYLLVGSEHKKKRQWVTLLFWSLIWSCLVLALAGPRWNFREVETFTRDQSLAILLDLSESMNAKDISPSRLGRAKQKVEDLLNISKGVKIGLIAFAADPHMIVPITEDKETIRHLLPSLDTDLVFVQGSKLAPALEMASTMLQNESGNNKAIVVISDGGFEDASAIQTAKKIAGKGIFLYTIGVGSQEGAPLKDRNGIVIKKNGSSIISKLEKEKFREISKIGNGRYFDADHSDQIALIFEDLEKRSNIQQEAHKTERFWEEHFYLFLLPVLPFFLWWYRRGYIFALLLFSLMPVYSQASLTHYFYNAEQKANQAYENGDYSTAGDAFQDSYRKGVAYYRMGDYKAAEDMFRQSSRPEVASSAVYNLGNALVQQNKLNDAIATYEDVLEKWPDHKQAKENLEIVKKMLEQQDQQQKNQEQQDQEQQDQEQQDQEQQDQEQQDQKQQDQKQQDQKQQDQKQQDQKQQNQQQEKQQQQEQQKHESNQNRQKDPNQQKDNQDQPQLQKEGASKNQEKKEHSEEHSQKDSPSPGKEVDNTQKEVRSDPKQSSRNPLEEKEPPLDEKEPQPMQEQTFSPQQKRENPKLRSEEDLDADLWLNQIKNDPKSFLKNKFYLESKKNGTKEEVNPW